MSWNRETKRFWVLAPAMPWPHSFIRSFPKLLSTKYMLCTRHMLCQYLWCDSEMERSSLCPTVWHWVSCFTSHHLCSFFYYAGVWRVSKFLFSSISWGFIASLLSNNSETEDYASIPPPPPQKKNPHIQDFGEKRKEKGMWIGKVSVLQYALWESSIISRNKCSNGNDIFC